MSYYRYFWDLANSTSYTTHIIGQFNKDCSTGGGIFRWINSSNIGITNIAGIRIKPTSTTNGYWYRVFEGGIKVGWFGTMNISSAPTFASLGYTQTQLDNMYGTSFATTTDNFDTTAIRYGMKLMETFNYHVLEFSPKEYYLNKTVDLPRTSSNSNANRTFLIDGKEAVIKSTTSGFIYFKRQPVDQSDALNVLVDYGFTIQNFNAYGNGSANQMFLKLGATLNTAIHNLRLKDFDIGLELRFCLLAKLHNIMITHPRTYGIVIDRGDWTGAGVTNAQSNVTTIYGARVRSMGTTTAGIRVIDCSEVTVRDYTWEGLGGSYGLYYDSLNASVVKDFTLDNFHVEVASSVAGVYIKANTGLYNITRVYNQFAQNLVSAETYSGYPQINVSLFPYFPGGTQFVNIGNNVTWDLVNLKSGWVTAAEYIDPLNNFWNTTLGTIPLLARVRVTRTIVS